MSPASLRKLRKRLGLSQQGLARRLGIARATVTRWENGTRRPSKVAELAVQSAIGNKNVAPWDHISGRALNELWNNPEDAVYDCWQEHYGSGTR